MDQPFSLTSEVREGVLVITTSGYVNNEGGAAIAAAFGRHFADGVKYVVINLARSKVVNSIGMSFLIEIIELLGAGPLLRRGDRPLRRRVRLAVRSRLQRHSARHR